MRTSPIHYIAPSAISIEPNCNGTPSDLAVTISRGAKIKVYSPRAGIDKTTNGEYQEWTLTGRNRRLADSTKPYTIYARLSALDNTAYLIFAPMTPQESGEYMSAWTQAYSWVTTDGLYVFGKGTDWEEQRTKTNCIFVRLGDVSLPDANNQRTVTLDTGILGTDQFNDEWALRPDELPLRIELGCTIGDEDAGPTPYVYWGQSLVLTAMLTEGWTGTDIQRFDRWEIIRNSGDAAADNAWNYQEVEGQDTLTPRQMPDGQITLQHIFGGTDDFNGAVSVTFTILAVGHNADTLQREILKTATINIMAETVEKYELSLSESIVSYDPQTQNYTPSTGVNVGIRATDQCGDVFDMTREQISNASLVAEYAPVGSSSWTALTFSGSSQEAATANIDTTAFASQQSVNVRLMRRIITDGQTDEKELARATIAFVRDGEDSKEREWIFLRSQTPVSFGDASSDHPLPSVITQGEVNPTGVARAMTNNNNQDGWVPQGWYDEMQGTDENTPYEFGAWRDYIHESNGVAAHWGVFSTPRLWSHYGKDGDSITKVSETYRYATNATGTQPAATSSEWQATKPATIQKGYWLFIETTITWSDASTTVLYTSERNPNDGIPGQNIVVDGATEMKYYVGSSNSTHPAESSSDWKDLSQVTQTQGKWLWAKATTYYRKSGSASGAHDAGYSVNYTVSYIAKDGGAGRGIVAVTEYYKASANATGESAPDNDSGWTTDPNEAMRGWNANAKYLWNYEKTEYSSGTQYERTIPQVLAIWTENGAAGKGVDSITNYYKITNSAQAPARPTTQSEWNTWDDNPMAPTEANPYLWNFEQIVWVNPAGTTYTDVQMIGHYGKDADVYYIKTNVDSVTIPADSSQINIELNGEFHKVTGSTDEVHSCAFVLYARKTDGQRNAIAHASSVGGYSVSVTATPDIQAYEALMQETLVNDPTVYLARKEIIVQKHGDTGPKGDDAQEVNPNILLRTIFDRGMDFVLEAWTRNSELIAIDGATDTIVNGRKSLRMNASSQDLDFQQNVFGKVKPSTWYTLSFNYFATQSFHTFLWDTSNITPWIDLSEGYYIDGSATPTAVIRIDGFHEWEADWSGNRHSITFKTASTFSTTTLYVLFRCLQGGQVAICMPKLEEGRTATAYMAHEDDLKGDNAPYNEHAYALSQSRTSHADGDLYQVNGVRWFPSAPDPMATHPYVWERIMHYTSAGVNDQTSYICLTGAVGAMGKLCYMAGEYRADVEYTSNDSQTVAVEVSGTGKTTSIYYLNAESNVVDGRHIGPTDSGQTIWVLGMSQYNLVRARYLFADFAQFGAAVVSGDWLISVHGTINGTEYHGKYEDPDTYINSGDEKPTYFWFDTAYPNEDHAGKYKTPGSSSSGQWASDHHNFIPHYAVNLLTGKTYQNDAYIRGEVYATDGIFNGVVHASDGEFRGKVYASDGEFTGRVVANSGSFSGSSNGFEIKLDADNGKLRIRGPIGVSDRASLTPTPGAIIVDYMSLGEISSNKTQQTINGQLYNFLTTALKMRSYFVEADGSDYIELTLNPMRGLTMKQEYGNGVVNNIEVVYGYTIAKLPSNVSFYAPYALPSRDEASYGQVYLDGETLKVKLSS